MATSDRLTEEPIKVRVEPCSASNTPITQYTGRWVDANMKTGKFESECPVCKRVVEVVHRQVENSEFTKNTGFPDMVPWYTWHIGRY